MANIAANLKRLRLERGWNSCELARRLHAQPGAPTYLTCRRNVSLWQRTTRLPKGWGPSLDSVIMLADVFGVTLDEIVGREPPVCRCSAALAAELDTIPVDDAP